MHPPQRLRSSAALLRLRAGGAAPSLRAGRARDPDGTEPGRAETASLQQRPAAALPKFPFEGLTFGAAAWTGSDVLAPG
ncbi:Hypothetical predicted protein [Marmota monax]|uniref:Uncharacterized protein n=1 Tax=Marmota monax TaxID=9995 RepID=A0A5E4BRN8_MARMO|nr:hypothetical protein GHT09_011733 [Marmota monax]VTJ71710.1 Hypothetical predicted protein [Marmota monax]